VKLSSVLNPQIVETKKSAKNCIIVAGRVKTVVLLHNTTLHPKFSQILSGDFGWRVVLWSKTTVFTLPATIIQFFADFLVSTI
jgi:hypothetical protein